MATQLKAIENLNTSGIVPNDVRILVLPDPVPEKAGSVFLPEVAKDRERMAMVKGTLVAVGANAFFEASKNPAYIAPQPGARVMIAKYGGIVTPGADGKDYRIMNDEDVIATLEE